MGNPKALLQNALAEARHFAGGLIPHPTESTKHYTILRHSPPLVFYRGPTTSVAITVFSSPDRPVPADRTLWLQQRGFSGDSGMKIKAFFNATSDWLDVTPATQVQAEHLAPETERAWQRDIAKTTKKLLKEKGEGKAHIARETHVVRIPEASDDGYFRLILCTGGPLPGEDDSIFAKRKALCTSPIFRVASTSTDSSVFRGASLSTLPLEMGVFLASMVATTAADTYAAPIRQPVEAVLDRVRSGFVKEAISGLVYDELSERSDAKREDRHQAFMAAHASHTTRSLDGPLGPIGPESGPEPPFPLLFQGKVGPGRGRSTAGLGGPPVHLSNVPEEISHRLKGVYFGWAQAIPTSSNNRRPIPKPQATTAAITQNDSEEETDWHPAIITIAPSPLALPSVTPVPVVSAQLISLAPSAPIIDIPAGATLEVAVLGYLRPTALPSSDSPASPPLPTAHQQQVEPAPGDRDVYLALASLLGREHWTAEAAVARVRGQEENSESGRGLLSLGSRRLGAAKDKVVRKVPSVGKGMSSLVKVVGIRDGDGEERDRLIGAGGYWVRR